MTKLKISMFQRTFYHNTSATFSRLRCYGIISSQELAFKCRILRHAKYDFACEVIDGCVKMPLRASIFTYGIIK